MRHFKSIQEIKGASVEELAALPEINRRAAEDIYLFFRKPPEDQQGVPADKDAK